MTNHRGQMDPRGEPPLLPLWPGAGRPMGCSRGQTYELARRGEFPIPVLRIGQRLKVRRVDLLNYLGLDRPAGERHLP